MFDHDARPNVGSPRGRGSERQLTRHFGLAHQEIDDSLLTDPKWIEWTEATWSLNCVQFSTASGKAELPSLTVTLYRQANGLLRQPPFIPYLPVQFQTSTTTKISRLSEQWLDVGAALATYIRSTGMSGSMTLSPSLLDARPFQWEGFRVEPRYTYSSRLPLTTSNMNPSVGKNVRKASRLGYSASRSNDWESIYRCLKGTAQAKGFRSPLRLEHLRQAHRVLGEDAFRGYIATDPSGRVVSGGIRLFKEGGTAIDWQQGTDREQLNSGVNQLLYDFSIQDLATYGASAFEFSGANIPSVAAAKAAWGMPLTPLLSIADPNLRTHAQDLIAVVKRARSGTRRLPNSVRPREPSEQV